MSPGDTVHASAALVGERGVLVRGAPGSGKSSLVLSLLARDPDTTALVADDRVALTTAHGRLLASAPAEIAGMMEIRGHGIVRRPWVSPVVVDLVVDLLPADECPRLPLTDDESRATVAGVPLPRMFVSVGAADGAARVGAVLASSRPESMPASVC
jgi:serine kinase of HPr protein (carbohydrate metabolism regulator)